VEEGLVLNVAVLQNDIDENTRPRMYSRSKFENKSRSILVNIFTTTSILVVTGLGYFQIGT
jgi:hypothetical protein